MKPGEFYLINAFTGENARGNQACVLMLKDISDTQKLFQIAQNFNLPATTFLCERNDGYDVRWFAPEAEIGLCGHGTIAATWVLKKHSNIITGPIRFHYATGSLFGDQYESGVRIEGKAIYSIESEIPEYVQRGFQGRVKSYFKNDNKDIVLLDCEESVIEMKPNWNALRESKAFGCVITADSKKYDFVSRTILPHINFLEDQATGSSHMLLTPFWSERLAKSKMHAYQASNRGGVMHCLIADDKVSLVGECQVFGHGSLI